MPAALAALLQQFAVKVLLPMLIQWAVKHNLIGTITGALAKAGLSLKIDHEPKDFPSAPPGQTNEHNFTTGKPNG